MLKFISTWFEKTFSDRQAVILTIILLFCFLAVFLFGHILTPLLAAIVISYLLNSAVDGLKLPRNIAVAAVFLLFVVCLLLILTIILPKAYEELIQFINNTPQYVNTGKDYITGFTKNYPNIFSAEFNEKLSENLNEVLSNFSKNTLSTAVQYVPGLLSAMIYLIMVPMMILFILKDKQQIMDWFAGFLPSDRSLASRVWAEVDNNIGNYVKGKFVEAFIVTVMTYIGFLLFDLQYALMLAVAVGISVFIPYIGAIIVTIPVALVGLSQFGLSGYFAYAMLTYLIIQALDGYVLVPILFSGRVNLHPAAILTAILFFGNLWGFWGLFFAIPLAILIQAVLNAWPRQANEIR